MKKTKTPSLVTIAILTMITVVFWAIFTVYRVFTNEPSPSVPSEIMEPLSPDLDTETINKIEGRVFFSEEELGTAPIATATPTSSPTPTPTISPTVTPTPTATASATPTP